MTRKRPSSRFTAEEKARFAFLHEIGLCCASGRDGEIHVAHISGPDHLFNKPPAGVGAKAHFVWTLPLSAEAHAEQHRKGERQFWSQNGFPWRDLGRGPMAAALILEGFRALDDVEGARRWIKARLEEGT